MNALHMTTVATVASSSGVRLIAPAIDCAAALFLGLAPRAARVPADLAALMAPGAGCSNASAARCARADHIADLIAAALAAA